MAVNVFVLEKIILIIRRWLYFSLIFDVFKRKSIPFFVSIKVPLENRKKASEELFVIFVREKMCLKMNVICKQTNTQGRYSPFVSGDKLSKQRMWLLYYRGTVDEMPLFNVFFLSMFYVGV